MVVVYLKHNGRRGVMNFTPKRKGEAWRKAKMNIIASYQTWRDFRQSSLYNDMKLTTNGYID